MQEIQAGGNSDFLAWLVVRTHGIPQAATPRRGIVAADIAERYAEGVIDNDMRLQTIRNVEASRPLGEVDVPGQLASAILGVGTLALASGTLACVKRLLDEWALSKLSNASPKRQLAAMARVYEVERRHQARLFHDIFGNPFRPINFDPTWRTTTVVSIAQAMYDSRDFSPMPLLADALQDAGCEQPDILDHCRTGRMHVRGCWVVDLILGKE